MNSIRVMILDDHPILRMGLRCCLEKAGDIIVVEEMAIVKQAPMAVMKLFPDVLLMGIKPPGRRGFEMVRQIKRQKSPKILVLSTYNNRMLVQKLLSLGVDGIITKADPPEQIVEAVRGLASGQSGWFSREVLEKMSDLVGGGLAYDVGNLSWRELEVLEALVEGKTNREIAVLLNISDKTVEKHLENVYFKLDVSSRVEAAVMAVKDGLVIVRPGKKTNLFESRDDEPIFDNALTRNSI